MLWPMWFLKVSSCVTIGSRRKRSAYPVRLFPLTAAY